MMRRPFRPVETNDCDVRRAKVWRNGLVLLGILALIGICIVEVGMTARVPVEGDARMHCKVTTWKELPGNLSIFAAEGNVRMLPDYVECDAAASGSVPGGQLVSAIVAQAIGGGW